MIIPLENKDRLLSPENYEGLDRLYQDRAVEAVRKSFPYERGGRRIEVFDVRPGENEPLTPSRTRDAVIHGKTLETPVTGRFRITDPETGDVLGETARRSLLKVPRLTPDGEMIRRGVRYVPLKQMRLDPGVYVRNREDGAIEAAVTVAPGTGRNFNILMDPETGKFNVSRAGRKIPLAYILDNMGMDEEDREKLFGELAPANRDARETGRLSSWRNDVIENQRKRHPELAGDERALFATAFTDIGLDPEVTKRTLGSPRGTMDTDTFVDAVRKMRKVRQGEHFGDSRDSLQFQRIYTFGDILRDRLERDIGGVMKGKMNKTLRTGNPEDIPTAPLSGHVDAMFAGAAPVQAIEGISPIERQSAHYRLTRLGEGAISSIDAAPAEARNVQHSYFNYIDGVVTPESAAIGLDVSLARNTFLDPESRRLFTVFERPEDGRRVLVRSDRAPDMVLSTREDMDRSGDTVPAMVRQEGIKSVPKEKVDLVVPSGDELYSPAGNRTYATGGIKSMRANMGARYPDQAVPVTGREAPLVDKEILGPDGEVTTMAEETGRKVLGALRAGRGGTVTKVEPDRITVTDDEGGETEYPLHDRDPLPRKTFFHQTPKVREGRRVGPGELLAVSNYTDDEGRAAEGTNLRVAWTPYEGLNFDDAVVISESAAEKLGHEAMYRMRDTFESGEKAYDKNKFRVLFPGRYGGGQLDKMDDRGVIEEGAEVSRGDPLVLAVTRKDTGLSAGRKQTNMDSSIVWDHEHDGRVEYVAGNPEDGYEIYVSSFSPMEVGDKIGQFFGGKGVVSSIVKNSEMLTDEKGRPVDLILNPYSIISRQNPAQVSMGLLGKAAEAAGQRYRVRGFSDEDLMRRAAKELKKHGLKASETLHNPVTGRDRPDTLTGNLYAYKLGHLAEQKGKARSTGYYTSEGQPARGGPEGGKHIGTSELNAMLAHGSPDVVRDMKIRGQRSDDLWRAVRTGGTPVLSGTPLVYEKYRDLMQAAGVNFTEKERADEISAMTGEDMKQLTGNNNIRNPLTFREKDGEPIRGGLMDPDIFGPRGDQWAAYRSPEPVYHPMMEPVAARMLDIPISKFRSVLAGEDRLDGKTGPEGIRQALSDINLERVNKKAMEEVRKSSGQARNNAVKTLRYSKAMLDRGVSPEDFFTDSIPVLPPRFRPISKVNDMVVAADMNRLYRELMDAGKDLEDSKDLPESARKDARRRYQNAYRSVVGTMDPEPTKLKETKTQGLLSQLFGKGSGKHGFTQRRVMGTNIDMSGLAVTSPDPSLRLDQIGLPEPRVWKLYEPLIVSEMVRGGWPAVRAARAVAERDKRARPYLDRAVKDRPVIVNRAPTLHKYGVMAFWPVITKGNVLRVPPAIGGPFGLDYDGNCLDYDTEIDLTLSKSELYDSSLGLEWTYKLNREMKNILDRNVNVDVINVRMKIGEFPAVGEYAYDRNGAKVYNVPKGVYIHTGDHNKGARRAEITQFTVEENCPSVEVTTYRGRKLTVSDNESLAVYDPVQDNTVKTAPKDAIGRLVPVIRKYPDHGNKYNFDQGWWYGALVADGWVRDRVVGYSKLDEEKRDNFVRIARSQIEENFTVTGPYSRAKGENGGWGEGVKIHLNGDLASKTFSVYSGEGKGTLHKRIPSELLSEGSYDSLVGVLSGLLDGDATVSWNKCTGKDRPVIRFNTSSIYLVESMEYLGKLLGVRMSVTTYPARGSSKEAYMVSPSIPDLYNEGLLDRIKIVDKEKSEVLSVLRDKERIEDRTDIVAFPAAVAEGLKSRALDRKVMKDYDKLGKVRKSGYLTREAMRNILRDYKDEMDPGVYNNLYRRVEDTTIFWDRIKSVKDAGERTVFDFEIPDNKMFAISNGLVVYDTMSYSVPVTERGRKDAVRKMMPPQNLMSAGDFGPHYIPSQEYAGGLYFASRPPEGKAKRRFATRKEALDAYRKGEIRIDDPVVVDEEESES